MPVAWSKPSAPLPNNAFDGGVVSAESLGRGRTIASNRGTAASGSENPASLTFIEPSFYVSTLVGQSSEVPDQTVNLQDPLQGKVLQFLSVAGEKGVIFFEPLGRREENIITNQATPTTDFREVEYSANAIGFSGAQEFKKGGSFGLSIAYLRGSLSDTLHQSGQPDRSNLDTGDGLRLNLGARMPTGPAMWGVTLQNFPGFLWWKDHKRQILPVKVRFGNTWRVRPGTLFSADFEQRYYREGSDKEDFVYFGFESQFSDNFSYRVGVYSDDIEKKEKRRYTGGVTVKAVTGVNVSYAFERFEINDEKVLRSILSVNLPFASGAEDGT